MALTIAQPQIYEGTLDEITARYGKELAGLRLKVIVDENIQEKADVPPFYDTATAQEWNDALCQWATSHDPAASLLSDADIDRESIYEGRGL